MAISRFAGTFNALDFNYGGTGGGPPLQVTSGSTATGAYTITCAPSSIYTAAGIAIPISTATPINVGADSGFDISITPTTVSQSGLNTLLITATFTYAHGPGAQVSSATFGLAEAMLAASKNGGGTVVVDAKWYQAGGTTAIFEAATQYSGVSLVDNSGTGGSGVQSKTVTLTAAQVNTMFTTPVQLLPVPAATQFYLINWAIFVNKNGGTAWTAGGAIEVGYGATVATEALSGTVAATFLTSPVVTQVLTLAGINPLATATASTYLAKPVYINNATQVFATGTGVLEVTLQYQIIST
jgi:hypothetical protein